LGTPPKRLSDLATWISAVAALLGVIVALIGHLAKGSAPSEPTRRTVGGSIVNGNVSAQGDFVGGNKITTHQSNGKSGHE
jgi:hypothetical protein